MSASPKLKASTFSVHDILSPLDAAAVTTNADTFLLLGCSGDAGDGPPAQSHHVKMSGSVSTPWPHGVATSHSSAGGFSGGAQYVNGAADLTSAYGVALTDSRPPHGAWYGTSSADPRFATDYSTLSTGTAFFFFVRSFPLVFARQTHGTLETGTNPRAESPELFSDQAASLAATESRVEFPTQSQ